MKKIRKATVVIKAKEHDGKDGANYDVLMKGDELLLVNGLLEVLCDAVASHKEVDEKTFMSIVKKTYKGYVKNYKGEE